MTDGTSQFKQRGSAEFSDETLRRFLLGELSAAEQALFEQRLFTADGLDGRVRLAEFDLADDYAYGRLSGARRELFEQNFLVSADRRRQVEVSTVLRDRFASAAVVAARASLVARLRSLFGFTQPPWRIAFGVLILLILFGTVWVVIKEPRLAQQVANRIIPRRSASPRAPREAAHPTNSSMPEHQITPSPMPVHDQTAATPVVLSLALRPRHAPQDGATPSLTLPNGDHDLVRLQLALEPDQTGPYRAEIVGDGGPPVFIAESLNRNEARTEIDFDVPARLLKTGDYQIKLSRVDGGSKGTVASYYLRVR